jgi:hypothetical protein
MLLSQSGTLEGFTGPESRVRSGHNNLESLQLETAKQLRTNTANTFFIIHFPTLVYFVQNHKYEVLYSKKKTSIAREESEIFSITHHHTASLFLLLFNGSKKPFQKNLYRLFRFSIALLQLAFP